MSNGVTFYQGPSALTGDPILGILTGLTTESKNSKTGSMLQTYILRADLPPNEAVKTGADDAICGDCVHRSGSNIGRSCYVIWWQAPLKVYQAYQAGGYSIANRQDLGRAVFGRHRAVGRLRRSGRITTRRVAPDCARGGRLDRLHAAVADMRSELPAFFDGVDEQ